MQNTWTSADRVSLWDAGTAKLLASLGYQALATTSSGHAATLVRLDAAVERDEALAHAASVVAAVDVPVSADLEDGFGEDPDTAAIHARTPSPATVVARARSYHDKSAARLAAAAGGTWKGYTPGDHH